MSNSSTPSGQDLRAVLERELEQRRGRAPEPGEIFVLSETAELPVEWALLEARPKAFLAIPADTQPLAGSRDFALGANVLSGPLVLRCGHAAEIATSRLRPELRTGLLDPQSLAAARSLQSALAAGTAEEDPLGEEVDRDPEYRDWVEEVLDPARAVLVGLSGTGKERPSLGADVVSFESRRPPKPSRRGSGSTFLRVLPWLVAAGLAIGLGWSRWEVRELFEEISAAHYDEGSLYLAPGTVRGDIDFNLPPASALPGERVRFSGIVPANLPGPQPMAIVLLDKRNRALVRSPIQTRDPSSEWAMSVLRSKLPPGSCRVELQSPQGESLASWDIRLVESPSKP